LYGSLCISTKRLSALRIANAMSCSEESAKRETFFCPVADLETGNSAHREHSKLIEWLEAGEGALRFELALAAVPVAPLWALARMAGGQVGTAGWYMIHEQGDGYDQRPEATTASAQGRLGEKTERRGEDGRPVAEERMCSKDIARQSYQPGLQRDMSEYRTTRCE
jgi:hypothetical protein